MLLFAAVAVVAYAADQVTKALAVAHLRPGVPVEVLGPVLRLNLLRNPGAAFSLATGATWVFTVVALAVAAAVVLYARRLGSRVWAVALGLLLAGAVGNLTDRLVRAPGFARGHVVDFLQLPRWPVFNLADSAICVAAVLVVLLALRGVDVDGARPRSGAAGAAGSPAPAGSPGAGDDEEAVGGR